MLFLLAFKQILHYAVAMGLWYFFVVVVVVYFHLKILSFKLKVYLCENAV